VARVSVCLRLDSCKTEVHVNNISDCSLYFSENALRVCYNENLINAMRGNKQPFLWKSYETQKFCVWENCWIAL